MSGTGTYWNRENLARIVSILAQLSVGSTDSQRRLIPGPGGLTGRVQAAYRADDPEISFAQIRDGLAVFVALEILEPGGPGTKSAEHSRWFDLDAANALMSALAR